MRSETFSTPEPPSLRINLPSGDVRIETGDTAETHVELSGPNEEEARIEMRRNEIVIELERKKLFGFRGDHRVVISAPEGTQLDAHTASGDVEKVGANGHIAASATEDPGTTRSGSGWIQKRSSLS